MHDGQEKQREAERGREWKLVGARAFSVPRQQSVFRGFLRLPPFFVLCREKECKAVLDVSFIPELHYDAVVPMEVNSRSGGQLRVGFSSFSILVGFFRCLVGFFRSQDDVYDVNMEGAEGQNVEEDMAAEDAGLVVVLVDRRALAAGTFQRPEVPHSKRGFNKPRSKHTTPTGSTLRKTAPGGWRARTWATCQEGTRG